MKFLNKETGDTLGDQGVGSSAPHFLAGMQEGAKTLKKYASKLLEKANNETDDYAKALGLEIVRRISLIK